jgi:hypothetical protein
LRAPATNNQGLAAMQALFVLFDCAQNVPKSFIELEASLLIRLYSGLRIKGLLVSE